MLEPWQQELAQSIRSIDQLAARLPIEHREQILAVMKNMRLAITPHTAALIDFTDPNDPLLRMSVPHERELTIAPEELIDPIGDETKSPVPFLTHRYRDRVLIYPTFACATYCRFCFRRFKTGQANPGPSAQDEERIKTYLSAHHEIDEAILTGGDPLTLVDAQLIHWFELLRHIPTIQRIRIHSRVPVNLPSRITANLIKLLRDFMKPDQPIFLVTHFNHPKELVPANKAAITRLIDAGIVVRNQSVLLKGINDDAETLRSLFKALTNARVVPYYLHQLDLARGTNHFRVPIKRGRMLMQQLQGHVTGIAMPRYVLDIPGGKGKIPLQTSYATSINQHDYGLTTIDGEQVIYREPSCE